jgi:hypothetical protein
MSLFASIADHRRPDSLAARLRRRRHEFFAGLLARVERPITILDVGGTVEFWRDMPVPQGSTKIVVLNVRPQLAPGPHFETIVGDARDLRQFANGSIDVVYSNSVIEHVGSFEDQRRMAEEVRRVGKRYFVQTPNKFFPIEPHFVVPGYQFMPLDVRAFLLTRSRLGWTPREKDWQRAKEIAASVRLMTIDEVVRLFPEADLYHERFAGLTKSVVAYHGW